MNNNTDPSIGLFIYEHPNGMKEWFFDGKRHREDGPAVELPLEQIVRERNFRLSLGTNKGKSFSSPIIVWWINGKQVSWKEVYQNANTAEDQAKVLAYAIQRGELVP